MDFLALHGFTQRGCMWDEVAALVGGRWLTPDLPGHGVEPPGRWSETVRAITARLESLAAPRWLVGYSLGGRLALAAALARPPLVDRLVLVSATAGLSSAAERRRRRARDRVLARHIEEVGMAAFTEEWLAHPLFAGLRRRPPEWRAADAAARAGHRAEGVAGALRRLGQGEQPYLGRRLGDLPMPVLLIAGGEDRAYVAEARRMSEQIGSRATVAEVAGAGHSVVGERPEEVAALLSGWLPE